MARQTRKDFHISGAAPLRNKKPLMHNLHLVHYKFIERWYMYKVPPQKKTLRNLKFHSYFEEICYIPARNTVLIF